MVDTDVIIRRLCGDDLTAYKLLRDDVLGAHPSAFTSDATTELGRTPGGYRPRLGLDRPEGGHFTLGAWRAGLLIGALSCERDARVKVSHIGHLIGMMVLGSVQDRGIGRALLDECIAQARGTAGLRLLTLSVTDGNRPAQHLYESAGFRTYGRLADAMCVDGAFHAKCLMSLTL